MSTLQTEGKVQSGLSHLGLGEGAEQRNTAEDAPTAPTGNAAAAPLPVGACAACASSATGEVIQELPPPPAGLEGESRSAGRHYSVTVSNKAGYMCAVHVLAEWPVEPETPFKIFTHPDNSRIFRDIQRVGSRNVIKTEPNYKEVQVEQLGEIQVLWMKRTYSTWLNVTEDARDPECLRIEFRLLRSDVLGKFSGNWELRPVRDPATGKVIGCRGELHQDVLPKGMPTFMARMPVLGGLLRGISVRAVTRVMDDMNAVLDKVLAGHAAGRSTEAVLRDLCGPVSEAAHTNGAVASFAFDPADEDEDEDDSDAGTLKEVRVQGSGQSRSKLRAAADGVTGGGKEPEAAIVQEAAAAVAKEEPAVAHETPSSVVSTALVAPAGTVYVVAEAVTIGKSA